MALVVALFVFLAQWEIIRKGKQLSAIQTSLLAAKDRQLRTELDEKDRQLEGVRAEAKEADARIAEAKQGSDEANARAKGAEASLASTEQHSAEANAKAEGFRAEIANANKSASEAQAQVAFATAEAARAKLETEKLKAVVAWRTVSPQEAAALTTFLLSRPGAVNVRFADGDPEAQSYALDLARVLQAARWLVGFGPKKFGELMMFGLLLPDSGDASAKKLRQAFSRANIGFGTGHLPLGSADIMASEVDGAPTLMVGSKIRVNP